MTSKKPIETYVERLVQVGRVFELYPDRIVVSASWYWGRPQVATVLLNSLKPDYVFQFIRYRLFKHGMLTFAVGAALAMLFGRAEGTVWEQTALVGGWGIAALGLVLSAVTYPRVMFARFPSRTGRGGLDVARSGPDRERFEAFVKSVQRQIRRQARS